MAKQTTTLSDSFGLRGEWWLPDTPDRKVAGELSFSPSGSCELSLFGMLRELQPGVWQGFSAPVIHGQTTNGKACTLVDAHESSFQMSMPGGGTSKFFYNQLVIGNQFVATSTRFESAVVELTDLAGWLHRDPFSMERGTPPGQSNTVTHHMPRNLCFRIPAIGASLRFEPNLNINSEYQRRTLCHSDAIRIKPERKQTLEWYLGVAFKFRMFLSLMVGEPVSLKSIRVCVKPERLPGGDNRPYRPYLDVCLQQVAGRDRKELLPPQIPFPYSALKKDLRTVLRQWYTAADNLSTLVGLHFGVKVNRKTPVEFQFLALIQAIESYHRQTGGDRYLPDDQYEAIRDGLVAAIPDNTPADLRAALKSRIRFGNEYSLRKRMTETLRSIPQAIVDFITMQNSAFIPQLVDTRNYLTHRDETQTGNIMDFKGMFNASESLSLLISYLLYRECGIPSDLIESVMLNHHKFTNRPRMQ